MLTKDYIVGLTDGEGSFCVFIRKPKKVTWNTRVECHFYIKMREDELSLLRKVQKFFGCGRIAYQREYRRNQRDNYRYQISDIASLWDRIIPFFKKNCLESTSRRRDFLSFSRIVEMVRDKGHKTRNGLKTISQLKSKMHN